MSAVRRAVLLGLLMAGAVQAQVTIGAGSYLGAGTVIGASKVQGGSGGTPLITVSPGYIRQNIAASSAGWKVVTPDGGNCGGSCPSSAAGGGVGTVQPAMWGETFSSTSGADLWVTASTSDPTGQSQALFVYDDAGCDSCNAMAYDQQVSCSGAAPNNYYCEMDISQNASTAAGGAGRLHMGGLQCDLNPSDAAYEHWEYDNEQGSWVETPITAGCAPGLSAEVGWMISWNDNDTTCGSFGCTYYLYLWINGTRYAVTQMNGAAATAASYSEANWSSYAGYQHQLYASGSGGRADRFLTSGTLIIGTYNPNATSAANPALQ